MSLPLRHLGVQLTYFRAEVVLAVLLESFKFMTPSEERNVVWNFAGVRYPTVGEQSNTAELPLKIVPINK